MMLSVETLSVVEVKYSYNKLLPLIYSIFILFIILLLNIIPSFFIDYTNISLIKEIYFTINNLIFNFKDELFNLNNNSSFLASLLFEPNFLDSNSWISTILKKYNNSSNNNIEDYSLININTFGEPSTLLLKNLQINTLGESIYGYYSILLILSGFLLLLAMIAPIVLARKK